MRSTVLLLALVSLVVSTALRHQHSKLSKEDREKQAVKVHEKVAALPNKAYFQALLANGKDGALKGEMCNLCTKLFTDIETFGEDTALDYLEPEVEIMCDGLPYDNLKKDCTDWVMSMVDDLVDILNDYTDGSNACVAMTLCDSLTKD